MTRDVTRDGGRDEESDGRAVTPLSDAERARRYRARKRRERLRLADRAGPGGRGEAGRFAVANTAAMRHGAFAEAITGPLAARYFEQFTAGPSFPPDGRDDLLLTDAVMAWAHTRAEVELLRQRRDLLDAELGAAGAVDAAATDTTTARETETRPAMGTMDRESVTRQQESLGRVLHRSETRLRTLRMDLVRLLAARGERKGPSLALLMAELSDEEDTG